MSKTKILYIVGAGFSLNAGLPLATEFTRELLNTTHLKKDGPSNILAEFLRKFVEDTFGDGTTIDPSQWPQLEDLFTTIDLAANTGHNLGRNYSASDLRAVRRALLVRLIRMLRICYRAKKEHPDDNWKRLSTFFRDIDTSNIAFLSMNWDTVIEDMLLSQKQLTNIDYGCSAMPAKFDAHGTVKSAPELLNTPACKVLKPHGSVNWMYCDSCSRLYWFSPRMTERIADRLFKESDRAYVKKLLNRNLKSSGRLAICPECGAQALGTRFATFSYKKALDFPMHYATWSRGEELLLEASRWIFIGYSMPAADYQFKHLLKRIYLCREDKPELLLVTGGGAAVDNYRRFFGANALPSSNIMTNGFDDAALRRVLE